jgi:cell fate regulator YaaT (PSP1 superfamily)
MAQIIDEEKVYTPDSENDTDLPRIIRRPTKEDWKRVAKNEKKEKDAYKICLKKIHEHKLPMKLVGSHFLLDRSKVIFYFTAEGRVDFRELVRDLAQVFKRRIELCQIGVRDETKIFGGYSWCGRPLCCATFLRTFNSVSIKMAKDQNLALASTKISGVCGRLMCCLAFEHENYLEMRKDLPKEGDVVITKDGEGTVVGVNILLRQVMVKFNDSIHKVVEYSADEIKLKEKEEEKVEQ